MCAVGRTLAGATLPFKNGNGGWPDDATQKRLKTVGVRWVLLPPKRRCSSYPRLGPTQVPLE